MRCPRCGGQTHVIESRVDGVFVRRRRQCGQMKKGKLVSATCMLRFTTVELPTGSCADVKITLTTMGLEAEVVRRKNDDEAG